MDGYKRGLALVNGCFDILTAGHVRLLTAAAQKGGRVLVAVNTDESVARLKGSAHPIVPFEDRVAILRSVYGVSEVVGFKSETDLERIIVARKPQFLVKGEDWEGKSVTGQADLESYGGQMVFVQRRAGELSSSEIVLRAAKSIGAG